MQTPQFVKVERNSETVIPEPVLLRHPTAHQNQPSDGGVLHCIETVPCARIRDQFGYLVHATRTGKQ
jgi:hypothetical protein